MLLWMTVCVVIRSSIVLPSPDPSEAFIATNHIILLEKLILIFA